MGNSQEKSCPHYKDGSTFTSEEISKMIKLKEKLVCPCGKEGEPELICLKCECTIICKKEHVEKHYEEEDSGKHEFYFDTLQEKVFCYQCNDHIDSKEIDPLKKQMKAKMQEWMLVESFNKLQIFDKKLTYDKLVRNLKNKSYRHVVILTGAGISVSAGIPDFRSPGSGIYDNLQKYKLKRPEELFTLSYFIDNPEVFYAFSKEFDLEKYEPTPTHYFIKLLQDKGLMELNLTQNIDNLEEKAEIDMKKLVQAHGSIKGASCAKCQKKMDEKVMSQSIKSQEIYFCSDETCLGPVKPNIVFFGEALPKDFFSKIQIVEECDLMIVIGTSLAVAPFNSLVSCANDQAHQVLINRENTKESGFDFESGSRKLFLKGNCDDVVKQLVKDLGWEKDFEKLLAKSNHKL